MANDDRDKRQRLTPPVGVRAQIAPPMTKEVDESFEGHTPMQSMHPTPVDMQTIRDDDADPAAPPPEALEHALDRRSREVKNTSITTLRLVDDLRRETKNDLIRVHNKIDAQDGKIDHVVKVVGDLSRSVGVQEGQNTIIIGMLKEQQETRRNTEHVVTTTRIAEVEVDKTRQLSELEIDKNEKIAATEIRKARKKALWEWAGKIGVVLIGIAGAVAAAYAKCG